MMTPRIVSVHGVKTPPNVPKPELELRSFLSRLGFRLGIAAEEPELGEFIV
jgi:hypothetical protein